MHSLILPTPFKHSLSCRGLFKQGNKCGFEVDWWEQNKAYEKMRYKYCHKVRSTWSSSCSKPCLAWICHIFCQLFFFLCFPLQCQLEKYENSTHFLKRKGNKFSCVCVYVCTHIHMCVYIHIYKNLCVYLYMLKTLFHAIEKSFSKNSRQR